MGTLATRLRVVILALVSMLLFFGLLAYLADWLPEHGECTASVLLRRASAPGRPCAYGGSNHRPPARYACSMSPSAATTPPIFSRCES